MTSTSASPTQLQAETQALLNGPAGTPPVGILPTFDDSPYMGALVAFGLCLASATLLVLMRMYTKLFLLRSRAYEDYFIVLAWLAQIGLSVPSILAVKHGGGHHMWQIQLKSFFSMLYWFNYAGILYGISIFLVKLSILLQYLRIFVPNRKGNMLLYTAIQFWIVCISIFSLFNAVFQIIECHPRERIWNKLITTGYCFNAFALFEAVGLFNSISDVAILILPMAPLWRLQMPFEKKLMMIVVFGTGIFACVTSIMRTYTAWQVAQLDDTSYFLIKMGLWSWGEISAGILVSCFPVIPKFFQHFGPKIYAVFSCTSQSRASSGHKSGSSRVASKIEGLSKFRQPLTKRGGGDSIPQLWKDSHNARNQLDGDYITLDDLDKTSPRRANPLPRVFAKGLVTKQDDLESAS